MREHLLGYLLGALDAAQQREVEEALLRDPGLRQELEILSRSFEPLEADAEDYSPPDGLAEQTCEFVSHWADLQEAEEFHRAFFEEETEQPSAKLCPPGGGTPVERPAELATCASSWLSLTDAVMAVCVCLVTSALFFPAIANSRYEARRAACQNNLASIGVGLAQYSDDHRGFFPAALDEGPFSVAGYYSVPLREGGYLRGDQSFRCPAASLQTPPDELRLPTREEVMAAAGQRLLELQRQLGGDFGFTLGVVEDGRVQAVHNRGRSYFAIMSDAPSMELEGLRSLHHGDCGQNVLFEDGRVQFVLGSAIAHYDALFYSERGLVEPGRHQNDIVIGRSEAAPYVLVGGN